MNNSIRGQNFLFGNRNCTIRDRFLEILIDLDAMAADGGTMRNSNYCFFFIIGLLHWYMDQNVHVSCMMLRPVPDLLVVN